jgi:hypothetical protein
MSHCLTQRKAHPVRPISRGPFAVHTHIPSRLLLDLEERVFAPGGPIHRVGHVDRLLVLSISATVRR